MTRFLCLLACLVGLSAAAQPLTLNDPGRLLATTPRNTTPSIQVQQNDSSGAGTGPYNDNAIRDYGSSQPITNTTAFTLTSLNLKLGNFSGASALGPINCYLHHVSGGIPVGNPVTTATNTILNSTLSNTGYPNGNTDVTFYFTNFPMVVTNYVITLHVGPAYINQTIWTTRNAASSGGQSASCSTNGVPYGTVTFAYTARWYFIMNGF